MVRFITRKTYTYVYICIYKMTIAPHIAQVSYNNINQLLHFRITFVKKEFCGKKQL